MTVGTEHGFSLTLATSGGTYKLQQVAGTGETCDVIETTNHGTTGHRTFISGDLKTATAFQVTVQFEGETDLPVVGDTPETITITHPAAAGETGGATIVGTGFISEKTYPGGAAGGTGLKQATMTIQWDGDTPPAFTAATTT